MTSKVLIISAAACCCLVQSKILRNPGSEIVRGQGFAAPPPGHQSHHNIAIQQSSGPARHKHVGQHQIKSSKPIKIISEFDNPGGFQPMKARYSKQKFEPTTEKSFVSGPPLGDDFLERYQELLKRSQQRQQLSFEGLLPEDIAKRSKRKHQDPTPPGLHLIKPPVSLDFHSASFENFNFNPNGKWYGEKETDLLQPPTHNTKHRQVPLDFISPTTGAFSPNNNWFGEKDSGFLEYPYHAVPKRETVYVTNPSRTESKENFSPSGWHVYRNKVIETGTRSSLYQNQNEPSVITIDNVAEYLKQNHHKFNSVGGSPDVFDVNVQAVIKTRDAPNASKQFYLDG